MPYWKGLLRDQFHGKLLQEMKGTANIRLTPADLVFSKESPAGATADDDDSGQYEARKGRLAWLKLFQTFPPIYKVGTHKQAKMRNMFMMMMEVMVMVTMITMITMMIHKQVKIRNTMMITITMTI